MIVYSKLAALLREKGLKWKDLREAGIGINTPQKFSQNKPVNTETIDKVCEYLHVQPGDIMEWVESEDILKEKELKSQIEDLQRQLTELQQKTK